jgi:hypothetical protein
VPDALGWIKYLDQQISKQALAGLMDLGQTEHDSRALGETLLDLFMLCLKSLADEVSLIATSGWPSAATWMGCAPGPTSATGAPPGGWPTCWPSAATWTGCAAGLQTATRLLPSEWPTC